MKALHGSQENWKVVENGQVEPKSTTNWSNGHMNSLQKVRINDNATLYILNQAAEMSDFRRLKIQNFQKKCGT